MGWNKKNQDKKGNGQAKTDEEKVPLKSRIEDVKDRIIAEACDVTMGGKRTFYDLKTHCQKYTKLVSGVEVETTKQV